MVITSFARIWRPAFDIAVQKKQRFFCGFFSVMSRRIDSLARVFTFQGILPVSVVYRLAHIFLVSARMISQKRGVWQGTLKQLPKLLLPRRILNHYRHSLWVRIQCLDSFVCRKNPGIVHRLARRRHTQSVTIQNLIRLACVRSSVKHGGRKINPVGSHWKRIACRLPRSSHPELLICSRQVHI
jgi:hypothetical protein